MYRDNFDIGEWKAKKQEERQAVFAAQEKALQDVFTNGEILSDYFYRRGQIGSHITSGNAALILSENPLARAVMPADKWNAYGRRVNKGAIGIPQITRSNGYYAVVKVFDVSQTYGNKPYPIPFLQENQFKQAVEVLHEISPFPIVFTSDYNIMRYDAVREVIVLSSDMPPQYVLQRLPAQIVLATVEHSYNEFHKNEYMQQTATAVAVEICGRLGLPRSPDSAKKLEGMKEHIPDGEERKALEQIREVAVTIGDNICKRLKLERGQPTPQREER